MTLRFLPFILLLAAAPDPAAPPMQTLQLTETPTPEGEQKVLPGAIIAKAAIARPDAAILAGDVMLHGERILPRGTVVRADAAITVPTFKGPVFCETGQAGLATKTAQAAPGVSGVPKPPRPRWCLVDTNADGKFDHLFPIDTTRPIGAAFVVAPTEYGVIVGRPLGATSVAQLRYLGAVPGSDRLAFELQVYLDGWKRDVPHPRMVVDVARLPAYGVVGSAVVTVLGYDRATGTATIRMDHGLAPGRIEVPELNRGY